MNGELERRRRARLAPFNGQTIAFASTDLTPLPTLRLVLLTLISRLQEHWPEAGLITLDDWHEHDGFISQAKPTLWHDLSSALSSDEALLTLSTHEFDVRRAFFPDTYGFYLRVYVPAEHDNGYPERRGDFDFTCAPELAAELADFAASASGLRVTGRDAQEFFDRRYGG